MYSADPDSCTEAGLYEPPVLYPFAKNILPADANLPRPAFRIPKEGDRNVGWNYSFMNM